MSLPASLPEKCIVAVTSKIVSLCEGRVVDIDETIKDTLIHEEAEWYLPRETNPFNVCVTIKNSVFIGGAGIDESNGNGKYVLWPKDVQKSANTIRELLKRRFNLTNVGVIITDSRLSPLRWGVTGVALSHSGFLPINSYVGKPDIFGRLLKFETSNIADMLAVSAVGVMGEGNEQTPLALIEAVEMVEFVDRNPTSEESLPIMGDMHGDVFSPMIEAVAWKKGEGKRH